MNISKRIIFFFILKSVNSLIGNITMHNMLINEGYSEVQIENFVETLPEFILNPVPSQVNFYLYTKKNPKIPDELKIDDNASLRESHYVKNAKLKLLSHGFTDSYEGLLGSGSVKEYLEVEEDINVVVIDWPELAKGPSYAIAAFNTQYVGLQAAKFLIFLVQQRYAKTEDFHGIGHSLGSHVVGNCGMEYFNISGEKLPRITGLDPANPLFANGCLFGDDKYRIDPSDAKFVDIIHTAAGEVYELQPGFPHPRGHVDFWPNGGRNQPGCKNADFLQERDCSHSRAHGYWIESIRSNRFNSCICPDSNWRSYTNITCSCDEIVFMGDQLPSHTPHGNYYLLTASNQPYALG